MLAESSRMQTPSLNLLCRFVKLLTSQIASGIFQQDQRHSRGFKPFRSYCMLERSHYRWELLETSSHHVSRRAVQGSQLIQTSLIYCDISSCSHIFRSLIQPWRTVAQATSTVDLKAVIAPSYLQGRCVLSV
eukprot:IDg1771t1